MEIVLLSIRKASEVRQQSCRLTLGAACLELIGELAPQVTLSEAREMD